MVQFKDGVSVFGIKEETITVIAILNYYFVTNIDKPLVITSCSDGKHMKNSKHYSGYAIDIRTRHLNTSEINKLKSWFVNHHGMKYDMVIEKDHIHVEYDPIIK